MVRRLRGFSMPVIAALNAAGSVVGAAAPDRGPSSVNAIPAETFAGGMTAEEEAAGMAVLHGWLMQEMPAGVLGNPIRVSLSAQEIGELQKRQQEKGGPAVVGPTKLISPGVRFSALDAALPSHAPPPVGHRLPRATPGRGCALGPAGMSREGAGPPRD